MFGYACWGDQAHSFDTVRESFGKSILYMNILVELLEYATEVGKRVAEIIAG
jgi:hypothetical protein